MPCRAPDFFAICRRGKLGKTPLLFSQRNNCLGCDHEWIALSIHFFQKHEAALFKHGCQRLLILDIEHFIVVPRQAAESLRPPLPQITCLGFSLKTKYSMAKLLITLPR